MASKRPAPRQAKSPRARPSPNPVSPTLPLPAAVDQLTQQILQLSQRSDQGAVSTRAEIGRLLLHVRERLPHGSWESWLEHHLPFTLSTAKRAIRLHQVRLADPALFARLAPLGVAKTYLFLNLPPEIVDQLLSAPQPIPSTGAEKPVAAMTFAELMEVVSALGAEQDLDAAEPLLRAYRHKVRGLIRAIDDLIEGHTLIAAADAEDELAELYDDLQQASAKLADAFSLEP